MPVTNIEIKVNEAQLRRVQDLLQRVPNALPKVVSRGINRTASSARTRIVRRLAEGIGGDVRQKDIRQGVRISKKATYTSWLSILKLGGQGISLMQLRPVWLRGRGGGVAYTFGLGCRRYFIRSAFIATMFSGHKGVFIRGSVVGKGTKKREYRERGDKAWWSELPIYEQRGPAAGTLFERTAQIAKEIMAETEENLEKNLDREIELILTGVRT